MIPQSAFAWTDKYRPIPYQSLGRTFAGVDCWGLVCLVAAGEAGVWIAMAGPDAARGGGVSALRERAQAFSAGARAVPVASGSALCVLLLARDGGQAVTHCAIEVGGGFVMHAVAGRGVLVEPVEALQVAGWSVASRHALVDVAGALAC